MHQFYILYCNYNFDVSDDIISSINNLYEHLKGYKKLELKSLTIYRAWV